MRCQESGDDLNPWWRLASCRSLRAGVDGCLTGFRVQEFLDGHTYIVVVEGSKRPFIRIDSEDCIMEDFFTSSSNDPVLLLCCVHRSRLHVSNTKQL